MDINIENDLREQLIGLLESEEIIFNKNDSTKHIMMSYFNALNRMIEAKKRKVYMSDKILDIIKNNSIDIKYIKDILYFKDGFQNGIDMKFHLSKGIFCSDLSVKNKKKLIYRQTRDYLLNDWGIHHIHLNHKRVQTKNGMRNNRSEYLLFIKITDNEVYFIDVKHHNEKNVFAKQEILETLDKNWHYLLEPYILPEIASVPKVTDLEIKKARENNNFMIVMINGKYYFPMGGGINNIGTNIRQVDKVDCIFKDLDIIEDDIKNSFEENKIQFEESTAIKYLDDKVNFKFRLDARGYVVVEMNTGFAIAYFYNGQYLEKRYGIAQL